MLGAMLGNLAAFNTALHLSLLPATGSFSAMSSMDKQEPESKGRMSALVSGSVADHSAMDYSRPLIYQMQGSYDPFSARPQARYSPTRGEVFGSGGTDSFGVGRGLPMSESLATRPTGHGNAATYPGTDSLSYRPRESLPRTTVIDNRPSSRRQSQDSFGQRTGSPQSQSYADYDIENRRQSEEHARGQGRYHTKRRPFNQDEFDGPSQYLPLPLPHQDSNRAQDLPDLAVHLGLAEQDEIMQRANDILSECAFHFVAKYQFPIPLERDKPRVRSPSDREWTEWAYLLKRLATKRRIPARVLYDNQIKQLVTILENSIVARSSANKDNQSPKRKPKDDRYILQLVSAATQVAKILMDSVAMEQLNDLYMRTENTILERRHILQVVQPSR